MNTFIRNISFTALTYVNVSLLCHKYFNSRSERKEKHSKIWHVSADWDTCMETILNIPALMWSLPGPDAVSRFLISTENMEVLIPSW